MLKDDKDVNLRRKAERDIDACVNCFGESNLIQGYFTGLRGC